MTRLPPLLSFGRRCRAIKTIRPLIGTVAVLVFASSARAAPRAAVLCVAVEERFVPTVTERAIVEAIRARVATEQLSVVACRHPTARAARWRLGIRRAEAGVVGIEARGENVVLDESLPVDERDGAEVARQVAIASAEMLRPTLIAWFDASLVESPIGEGEKPVEPAPEPTPPEPEVKASSTSSPLFVALAADAGGRYGGHLAAHVGVAAQLRYRRWRVSLDGGGDRWAQQREGDVTSRFVALEAGGTIGRELVARRLWLDGGGQVRFTRASMRGPGDVAPRVSEQDWGLRGALTAVIWRDGMLELGVSGRVSWWRHPMRLFYEGRELARQTHIDLLVAPYFALVL